jgi:hypothetical protein
LLLSNTTQITALQKPFAAAVVVATTTPSKADVLKMANELNELTAKIVKKQVKPNAINK